MSTGLEDARRFAGCKRSRSSRITDWALNNFAFERVKSSGFNVHNYGTHRDFPQLHNFQVTVNNSYEYLVLLLVKFVMPAKKTKTLKTDLCTWDTIPCD